MKKIASILLVLVLICNVLFSDGMFVGTEVDAASTGSISDVTGKAMKITKKRNATYDEMIKGYNSFALKALKEVIREEKDDQNLMISASSLMFALDMAASGAKGKTFREMADLLYKGATKRDIVSFAVKYRKMLENSDMMKIANSIFINKDNLEDNKVSVSEEYLNFLKKYFKAAAASMPFDEEAKKIINGWISDHTNGMIKEGVDKLERSSIMLLINAMAFEGKWKEEYKDYQINEDGKFTNSKGEKETAKMLSSEENWFLSSDTAKGFLKYYEGDKYAFMAMLPNDSSISIKDYAASLDDDALEKFYNSRRYTEVDTVTPAFSFDYSLVMNKMLKKLGVKKAFKKSANFFDMLGAGKENPDLVLYIGSVIQKTHIELDEKGTKAAAVTIIDMKCETTAYEPEKIRERVVLDRPFLFAIMDTETGTPVFTGIVNTVK